MEKTQIANVKMENQCVSVDASTPQMLSPSLATVEAIAEQYAEPAWMREARREAWALYQHIPLPYTKEEAWRRMPVQQFPMDSIHVALPARVLPVQKRGRPELPPSSLEALPPCWFYTMVPEQHVSGSLVHCNGVHTYTQMRDSDARQGVVFTGLHQALQTHGDLIRQYWMRGSNARPDFNTFTALNAALWHGGTFLYVPAGVHVARPLQSLISYDIDGGTGLHHTLVIAEKGSRVTLIQDRVSQEHQPEMNVEVVEIYAEAGAWVRYIHLQHWGSQRYSVSVQDAALKRDTNFVWVSGALGGGLVKDFMRSDLQEPGARAQMRGFAFTRGKQRVDQSTYQHHQAPHTYSNLLFRNVVRDTSRTVFYGMIRVEPGSHGIQGYQASNNLLLDGDVERTFQSTHSKPRAYAIPGLEIAANDVQCSHGATVSRIDPEQLFYLQTRGVPHPDAERLIVQGFLWPIVEGIPLAHVRDRLDEEIVQRFWLSENKDM
ncbi:MAG: Fe-S cluster assembly protein SufD [Anaerolineae bacterium]|nr:Fe-S cluster assembly protein SufD [Anaerolineae bacterium]